MGWSSKGYSYTKEEIDRTAYAAGCGKDWYWIHKRPNMFLGGYINDDGTYELTFYKAIASIFEYFIKIWINGKLIFNLKPSDLNHKTKKVTVKGNLNNAPHATVVLQCGAPTCDVGANVANGKKIIDVDLYPYVRVFTGGSWHRAIVYINTNNTWRVYRPFIFNNKQWKKMNNS